MQRKSFIFSGQPIIFLNPLPRNRRRIRTLPAQGRAAPSVPVRDACLNFLGASEKMVDAKGRTRETAAACPI
jgi:hypothetical protein